MFCSIFKEVPPGLLLTTLIIIRIENCIIMFDCWISLCWILWKIKLQLSCSFVYDLNASIKIRRICSIHLTCP